MGSDIVRSGFSHLEKQSVHFEVAQYTVVQLGEDLNAIGSAYRDPNGFLNYQIQNLFKKTTPYIKEAFSSSLKNSFYFTGNFFASRIKEITPYILSALKTSKLALQLMLSDIFEAFVTPLSKTENYPLLLNTTLAANMICVSLLIHNLAVKYLQEEPTQSLSITYGAITGIFTSYIMDQDIFIGTLAGASIGLITDSAVSYISSGNLTVFFKNLYKKFEIAKRAESIQNCIYIILPYITNTLGTALVYSHISPIVAKVMEEEIPSKKLHVIKMVAISGMLFGMGKSYLLPILRSLLIHIKIGAQSAKDTGIIASWAPRIFSILIITSLISPQKK